MHAFQPNPVPLILGEDGVIRVAETRVTLDTIVASFDAGATAEEIAQQYPTVQLEKTYSVIAWVLHHRPEVEDYLARRAVVATTVRKENERRFPSEGIRARLLARRR